MPMRAPRPCARTVCSGLAYGRASLCAGCLAVATPAPRYDWKWAKARAAFLAVHPTCACGCGARAEVVDHVIPHRGDEQLFWDQRNWQAMAKACHSRKTAGFDQGFGNDPR